MRKWLPTSRAGLALFFLLLGLVVLFQARRTYLHYAKRPIKTVHREAKASAGTAVQATIKELRSKLEKSKVGRNRYAVAAEKNLFSPYRRAWHPPTPEAPAPPKKVEEKTAPVRRDVILYGTYIAGSQKKAILRFARFRKGYRRLAEGEEARDEGRKGGVSYTLLKVEARKVVLKDSRGREFEIGLYDNKRRRPAKTTTRAKPQITVEKAKAPVINSASAGTKGGSPGPGPKALSSQSLRKLPPSKKEALVKQGVLRKISTPFGTVYRAKPGKK
jgi:hypothetical protein